MNQTLSSLLEEGKEYVNLGKLKDAEATFKKAYETAKANKKTDALIQTNYYLGKLYMQRGEEFYDDAERYLKEAQNQISAPSDIVSHIRVRIRNQLGLLCYRQNKLSEALHILEKSRNEIEKEKVTPELAETLHYSGLVLHKQRKQELGYECYEEALNCYTQLENSLGQARVFDSIANARL